MMAFPAVILCAVFVVLSGVHVYWIISGGSSMEGVVPTREGKPLFQPGKASTLLVAVALLFAALISLWRGADIDVGPTWVPRVGIWILAVIFALRAIGDFRYCGVFKRIHNTRFARNDSLFFSPLCAAISGLALWLALRF